MASGLSARKPQSTVSAALERCFSGKPACRDRPVVRIVKCSLRLSDPVNLWGGYKQLEDQLRYSGLIPDDDPGSIVLDVDQIKVAHKNETGTFIRIIYPE